MKLLAIPKQSLIGKALRLPLRLVPKTLPVRILQGVLKGYWWMAGSSNHGCWLGIFEVQKSRRFAKTVKPGMVVVDLGAHAGFYTLLASILTGNTGKVFAFEPLPRNIEHLQIHIHWNKLQNVIVLPLAVSDSNREMLFMEHEDRSMGRLDNSGKMRVKVTSLDEQLSQGSILPPDIIKIDIEGEEVKALKGAISLLQSRHPTIFLATHGDSIRDECLALLGSLGYNITSIGDTGDEFLAHV